MKYWICLQREVQSEPILTNTDCVGQNKLCKVESPKNLETPKQDTISSKTDDININESHSRKIGCELFGVTEKDLDFIDMENIFDDDKVGM